jgi:HAE1 family hydrophobic/amphiphilic exporter-1
MQWLAEVCVKRPVFTWVLMLALVVVGGVSFLGLGVDRFPNIDVPIVIVTTRLPGASPEQIERDVTDRIEEAVSSVSGIDELSSNSYEGLSVVSCRFVLEKRTDVAAQEVTDRINRILSELPEGAETPQVLRVDPGAAPVIQIAVISSRSRREVTDFAETRVRRLIESLDGVGGVTVIGGQEREIAVVLDPRALESFGLTARDVQRTLATENVEVPGGDVQEGGRTLQLRILGRVRSVEELGELAIATRSGRVVRVRDVATLEDTDEEASSAATLDGESTVIVQVQKQSGTNTVAVVDALYARLDEIRAELPPSYRLEVVRDESEFIRNSIHAVEEHLFFGSLLASFVVLLFLRNGRSTLISALAIPTSVIATFALIRLMGLTLNTITLLALTLSVGIVIDDAIVVLENIVRWVEEKNVPTRKAAILATREIGLAVLATTLSLVAVFLPVAFMSGIIGRFMSSFGLTMSFAIMVSLFVSFTLTPMLSARWLKGPVRGTEPEPEPEREAEPERERVDPPPGDRRIEREQYLEWVRGTRQPELEAGHASSASAHHGHTRGAARSPGLYGALERAYLVALAWAMRHRWVVGILLVITLAGIPVFGRAVAKTFLPLEDESRFEITMRAPEGISLAQTQIVAERMAREVRAVPGIAHTVVTVGSPPGDPSGRGPNQAAIFVAMVPAAERELSQADAIIRIREQILPHFASENLRTIISPINGFGGGGAASASIQYVLRGSDIDELDRLSQAVLTRVREIPGTVDADVTLVTGRPAFEVRIDRARASDLGVNVVDLANALRLAVGGVPVGTFADGGEQYDVLVRADLDARADPRAIGLLTVPTSRGGTVRVEDVAEIVESLGPASIQHLARQRQVTIYSNVQPGASEAAIMASFEEAFTQAAPPAGYRAQFTGRSRELRRAGLSFLIAVGLSFLFMYLVLAAQFESWIHPITILISLPLTIPFALFSLVALGQSLNIYSALGILVLFGVVKKNSILQVDHTRGLRREGFSRADAVMLGNRDRLRPILMTTVAFVAGMLPLMLSSGAGAGTNRAIGAVIIGGQSLSLLLTLIATPVVYSWLDDLGSSRFTKLAGRLILWPFQQIDRVLSRSESHHPAE